MGSDHYFSATPASPENLRRIRVTLSGRDLEVTTARGFRVLKVRRHGSPPSEPIALPELSRG